MINLIKRRITLLWIIIRNKIDYILFCITYRKNNSHNLTIPGAHEFNIKDVTVGKYTYGKLDVRTFSNNAGEKLIIGNYVSIADDVRFLLGGNHQMYTATSFPLRATFTHKDTHIDATSKGPIIIEDEVWIGFGVIILSGVKVGKGAIIAAGSVITKNVPPYAIVGGNPAKIIKYRYSEDIINALNGIELTDIDEKTIIENIEEFYRPIDIPQIERIKKLYSNNNK